MPNRMLRDWTYSDKINTISVHAERFFIRLIMKVDDYGIFYANTSLLKANLFPLLLDSIRETDITRWMAECQKAGIVLLYESQGKRYVQICEFKQRLDKARIKYPLPENGTSLTTVNEFPPEEKLKENKKLKTEEEEKVNIRPLVSLTPREHEKLSLEFSIDECNWMYDKLNSYKLSNGKKYKSDYGAILNWVVKSLNEEKNKISGKKDYSEKKTEALKIILEKHKTSTPWLTPE